EIELRADGCVEIATSACPHGQGHETTFSQIASQRLGVELERIAIRFGDSAVVPPGVGTFGSRSMAVAGSAIAVAIDKLIELAAPFAAQLLGCDPADVRLFDGAFIAPNVGSSAVSWAELARARNRLSASARFESPLVFSSGAYAAAVEIERATGALRIVRL